MPSITRFAVRSNGRDIALVRRPQRMAAGRPRKFADADSGSGEPVVVPVLDDMLKADLVVLAESRGIDSSGTKAELLSRLGSAHG